MDQWKNKVVIITGASSGIGEGIVEALVKNGLKVVGLARRVDRLNGIKQRLSNESGEFHPIKCDVTVEDDILKAFEWTKNNLGGVDILVNNAGISAQETDLATGATDQWRKVFETNVLGLCMATREAIKSMKERDVSGYIIHINSVAGHYVPVTLASRTNVYCGSKYAVTALAETLRLELATNKSNKIKVTSLSPGAVLTEIMGSVEGFKEFSKHLNLHPMEPKDIANAVLYLLSTPPTVHVTELTVRSMNEVI